MEKNTAGKWTVFAYGLPSHISAGQPISGDAANITANICLDGGVANPIDNTNPTELGDGYYIFDITAAEAGGDLLTLIPTSATPNVQVISVPGSVYTRPPNFNSLSVDSNGRIDLGAILGTAQTANDNGAALNTLLSRIVGTIAAGTHSPQTGDSFARLGSPAGVSIAADIATNQTDLATVDSNVNAILVDTSTTLQNLITNLNNLSTADINNQMLDVLGTDTFSEPSGVPPATTSLVDKIGFLYMALRNRIDVTADKKTFYDDNGVAAWEKDLSDAAGTYSESEGNLV